MLLNRTFLAMAMARGLNMAIANPMNSDFIAVMQSVEALNGKDDKMSTYLAGQTDAVNTAPAAAAAGSKITPQQRAYEAILHGNSEAAKKAVNDALQEKCVPARTLLDDFLLSAIALVGKKFEQKEYFLPQLLGSAEALQAAIKVLEPALQGDCAADGSKEKFIIATVKGDIHDIGKNIVALMLENSGFEVIDLGKDVPAEVIVERAARENCRLIGLSALMTTTMTEMPKVIELAAKSGLQADFIVGGAVVDEAYAASIEAHYAADAMMTVNVAREILKKKC
jgi:5-methyltetrahydrofolate--homocysteine methyltransferase